MGSRRIEHFADQGKLAAVGGRQVGSAAENSLNVGQGAHLVIGREPCQNGINNRVGSACRKRVNRYVCTRDQLRPEFGRSDVGALNGIGAEIRTGQIGVRVARQQPFVQQIFVEV